MLEERLSLVETHDDVGSGFGFYSTLLDTAWHYIAAVFIHLVGWSVSQLVSQSRPLSCCPPETRDQIQCSPNRHGHRKLRIDRHGRPVVFSRHVSVRGVQL